MTACSAHRPPGIGQVASTMLTAEMPELGYLSGEQAAALTGLAPIAHDSGVPFAGNVPLAEGEGHCATFYSRPHSLPATTIRFEWYHPLILVAKLISYRPQCGLRMHNHKHFQERQKLRLPLRLKKKEPCPRISIQKHLSTSERSPTRLSRIQDTYMAV